MQRTLDLIGRYYWWPGMQEQVASFIKGCVPCQRSKPPAGATAGKLQPLPVPQRIWEEISMDFIGPLPLTPRGFDMVLVVVDRLSKMAIFIPCKSDITSEQTGRLLMQYVFSKHGIPATVLSDRGTQFTAAWLQSLYRLLGTKQLLTTAYHPQTNGQSERVNRTLTEVLRHLVDKTSYDDWDLQLPLVEFAHNNAKNRSTGASPFMICYGKHPRTPMELPESVQPRDLALAGHSSVLEYLRERERTVASVQEAMHAANQRAIAQEDSGKAPLTFEVGDQVSLKTKHLQLNTLPSKKLFPKWIGPMRVHKVINPSAYMLELPSTWRIHPVFHVSLLKPYFDNGEAVEPVPFTLIGGADNEFQVDGILDFKPKTPKTTRGQVKARKVRELSFYVKWQGLDMGVDAWQPWENLKGTCNDALSTLAKRFGLPEDLFHKGSHLLPLEVSAQPVMPA